MTFREKLSGAVESNAVVNGLESYYTDKDLEKKTDLKPEHITAEMSIVARAVWTIRKWGITRSILGVDITNPGAIHQFDARRISNNRGGRGEMVTVLSAEQRKEEQSTMDKWLGGLKR